jgi:hypothetical protein
MPRADTLLTLRLIGRELVGLILICGWLAVFINSEDIWSVVERDLLMFPSKLSVEGTGMPTII